MAAHLSRITSGVRRKPIRLVIHGHPGAGKTLLASGAAGAIFQTTEDGLGLIDAAAMPKPTSFDEVIAQYVELATEAHKFNTLVVDAIDGIEPLVFAQVCADGGKPDIASFGFNKGYVAADALWVRLFQALDGLREAKAMNIVLLSHSQAVHYDDPTTGTYVRWEPNLHKRTVPLLTKWADVIGFLDHERMVVDKGDTDSGRSVRTSRATGSRFLHLTDTGSFIAKNRFDLPPMLEIPLENGWEVFRSALVAAYEAAAPASKGDADKKTNRKTKTKKVEAA